MKTLWFIFITALYTLLSVTALQAQSFSKFQKNGKWGILDKNQQVVIPIRYDNISHYYSGFTVTLNKKQGFLDHTGKEVFPVQYEQITEYSNKLIKVKKDGKFALFTNQGKALTPHSYSQIFPDDKIKLFQVTIKGEGKNKKMGFYRLSGQGHYSD